MRRLTSHASGGPETLMLEEVADPVAGPSQVVIRIAACSVNYPDSLIIVDRYQYKPERPFAPGCEVAGVVESVGPGVSTPKVGDRVMAMTGWGGMADRVVTGAHQCIPIPDAMPFDHGASFIMTYGTAFHALRQRAAYQPGETMLVLGAAGGVGLAAVEIGAAIGARVIAATSSQQKLAVARERGAAHGFVYPPGKLDKTQIREVSGHIKALCPGGADIAFDPVGGDLTEAAVRGMGWNGRLLIIGFPAGICAIPANLLLLKGASAIGVFYGHFTENEPEAERANMREMFALYEQGKLRPTISARFPLERGADAIAALADQGAFGKIVIEIGDL